MKASRADWIVGGIAMVVAAAILGPVAWWLLDGAIASLSDDLGETVRHRRGSLRPWFTLGAPGLCLSMFVIAMGVGGVWSVWKGLHAGDHRTD